jgi:hypothetical protein
LPEREDRDLLLPEADMERTIIAVLAVLATSAATAQAQSGNALIARAKIFELDTPYIPPPGEPLAHHAAGYAKVMCSAVFMTGLTPEFAAESVGFFTAPYGERRKLGKPVIDRDAKTVSIALPDGTGAPRSISAARAASPTHSARAR